MNLNQIDSVLVQLQSMGFEDPCDEILGRGKFAASTNQEIPMNTSKRYVAIAAFAIAASVFGSAAAIAADSDGHTLFRRVSYKDLDLNSESGVGTLYKRIKSAAETVCAPYIGRELVQYMNQVACVTSSFERAVKQVNQPLLTRYYLARHPKSDLGTSLTATR